MAENDIRRRGGFLGDVQHFQRNDGSAVVHNPNPDSIHISQREQIDDLTELIFSESFFSQRHVHPFF
jgi:hypothetical protein